MGYDLLTVRISQTINFRPGRVYRKIIGKSQINLNLESISIKIIEVICIRMSYFVALPVAPEVRLS